MTGIEIRAAVARAMARKANQVASVPVPEAPVAAQSVPAVGGVQSQVEFVCPQDSGLPHWYVRFKPDRYADGDRFEMFPGVSRFYSERTLRNLIPAELDEVLLEMNKADIVL